MSDKKRWPHAEAMVIAEEIVERLKPKCERIEIAGSLRRQKPTVGDVEILFIPRMGLRAVDMFDSVKLSLADEEISAMLGDGTLSKRPSKTGTFAWGKLNKLALHRSWMPVDLFTATEENWANYLVCRTGPAELNTLIAMLGQGEGWKWAPYGSGFVQHGESRTMKTEREVFEFVGLDYVEPHERTKEAAEGLMRKIYGRKVAGGGDR